ncbi:MAG: hypothetical protein ABWY29_10340 [Blastococcus sp.]
MTRGGIVEGQDGDVGRPLGRRGGGIVLARAVAADLTTGVTTARLFSLFMTLSSVAPIAESVAGGAVLAWTGNWRVAFHLRRAWWSSGWPTRGWSAGSPSAGCWSSG